MTCLFVYAILNTDTIWNSMVPILIYWGHDTAKDATNYVSLFPWYGFSRQAGWDALCGYRVRLIIQM